MRRLLIVGCVVLLGTITESAAPGRASEPTLITGGITTHIVERGETLTSLAADFGVDSATIVFENHLLPGRALEPGSELLIDNRHIGPATIASGEIIINVPQRMLFYRDGGRLLAYPIAVGRRTWQTPAGPFTVVRKEEDPAWHVPASIRAESARKGRLLPLVVPPGPSNPLGRFWIGLSVAGIGVHGTPLPSSIYQTSTHGCIRLQGDGIEDLFGRATVGTPGRIVYEPVLLAADGDEVYLEVHPDVYHRSPTGASQRAHELAKGLGLADRINWTLAGSEIERRAGVARRVSRAVE
jgi:L,D-transpeptidase ErfK/SrfK